MTISLFVWEIQRTWSHCWHECLHKRLPSNNNGS